MRSITGKISPMAILLPYLKRNILIRLNGQTCSRRPGQNTWFLHRNITMGSAFGPANTRLVGTAPSLVLKQILSTGFQTQLGRRDFISGCTTRSWSGLTLLFSATIEEWVDSHMIPQMKELVNSYKPDIIFSDGEWDYDSKTLKSEEFLVWLYNSSPVKEHVV